MDYESIKGIGKQLSGIWRSLKSIQKLTLISSIVILIIFFSFIAISQSYPSYVQLFPNEKLQLSDSEEIVSYLNEMHIPYKVNADASILVPVKDVQQARAELMTLGLPKGTLSRGYDLFDNSTWIRGEKELQILELRALRGQLEQDIAQFDNIRSASVILDIAPVRTFGGSQYRTKASIILNLIPGTTLPHSEIEAITYHVASAVRGLMPNMVAISDTTGKLYQAWDPEGVYEKNTNVFNLEDQLKGKIDGFLSLIAGPGKYFSTIHIRYGRALSPVQPSPIDAIYISVALDQSMLVGASSGKHEQQLRDEIRKQILSIVEPYHAHVEINTNFVSFKKGGIAPSNIPFQFNENGPNSYQGTSFWMGIYILIALACFGILILAAIAAWRLNRWLRRAKVNKKVISQFKSFHGKKDIDLEQMLETLKEHVRNNPKGMADEIRMILMETPQDKM